MYQSLFPNTLFGVGQGLNPFHLETSVLPIKYLRGKPRRMLRSIVHGVRNKQAKLREKILALCIMQQKGEIKVTKNVA